MSKRILSILLSGLFFCLIAINASGQKNPQLENLPKYDERHYHFGFLLGANKMDFAIRNTDNFNQYDSLMKITPAPQLGFNIGIVSDLKLGKHFDLRFIPELAFGERRLNYTLMQHDTMLVTQEKRIESTFIDFPLLLKYKSARFMANSRAYVVAGIKYSVDLASQAGKKDQNNNDLVKLKKNDLAYEFGVGFDFYLEYFKFAIEVKMGYGVKDLLVRDNTVYTNSIDRLHSKITTISFLFE
jgi:hypothetical protein